MFFCFQWLAIVSVTGWALTWKTGKSGKSRGKYFCWKSQGNSWKSVKVREKWNCFSKWLRKSWHCRFVSIFCQRIRVISVTICYTDHNLIWSFGKTFQVRKKSGKMKTSKYWPPSIILCCFQSQFSWDAQSGSLKLFSVNLYI